LSAGKEKLLIAHGTDNIHFYFTSRLADGKVIEEVHEHED
jgi:hypothetical protein